ncbi:MAG: hypothetical protein HWN66_16900 [Candidatus Helarchaeota archaeon]|nr:hypothetical protein [Candidatus Helarchaeota archaeon]
MSLNLGTTGIGSHPVNDPKRVIFDIFNSKITHPYVPQLSTDDMIFQFHHKFPGLSIQRGNTILDLNTPDFETKLREFKGNLKLKANLFQPHGIEVEPDFFKALFNFSEFLNTASNHFKGIKCQMTGPITEAASIKLLPGNAKLILNSELFDLIVDLTAEIAHWLSYYLLRIANSNKISKANVILFIDEPLFPLSVENDISYKDALEKLSRVLQLIQCKKGIHICDNPVTVIDTILKYPVDLFSYDAIKYSDSLKNTKIEILHKFIEKGGGFAFGITPNTPESVFGVQNITGIIKRELNPNDFYPTPSDLIHTLQKNIHPIAKKGIPIQKLLSQSLITPACGFRHFNIPTPEEGEIFVKQLLEIQEQAAEKLRNTYDLNS